VKYALVLALASCGRFGFSDANVTNGDGGPGDGGTSSAIRVVLTTDESPSDVTPFVPAGMPIASATVLVDHGTGTLERLLTDAQGSVTLPAEGIVAYHVITGRGNAWRVYTVATGATGTIALGGIPRPPAHQMSLVLPNGPGNTFSANLPERCASLDLMTTPSLSFSYAAFCEGLTVRAIGFASNNGTNPRYLDAGTIKLAQGTQATATGSYNQLPTHSIKLSSLPAGAAFVTTELLARSQIDLTRMEFGNVSSETQITGAIMSVTPAAAPGANTLHVTTDFGRAGRAVLSTSEQIAPVSFSAAPISASVDASTMLPAFTSFDFDTKLNLTWAGGGTGGTMIVVELSADSFRWDGYLPATATSLSFPVIPADIGFPQAMMIGSVDVMKLDVPGATAVGLTPAIDQTWRKWPEDPALLPAAGNRRAKASFISGL
jgi:hypothetical protein